MRDALDTRDLGKVMHAFRTHPHHGRVITQETAAGWVGMSQSRLSRIEQGGLTDRDPARQLYWAHVLDVPAELLWFKTNKRAHPTQADDVAAQADKQAGGQETPKDPMRRRTLLHWGVAATTSAGLDVGGGRVGNPEVERLQRAVGRLDRLDQRHGGETLWRAAAGHVDEAYLMLERGTYTEAVGQQLLSVTGRLQEATGWLAFDAGQQTVARTCLTDALGLARQSGNAETEIFALSNLAFQSITLGRPREGLRFAVTAEQATASLREPSVLLAIPYLRQARASALAGETRASDQAITQARRVLDRDGGQPTEEWLVFLDHAEIDRVEASCAMDLGRPSRAEALLEPAVAGLGDRFARNRAAGHVQLSRSRLDRKEVDGAVEAAHAALDDLADDVASWRVTSRLDTVAQRLNSNYSGVTGVDGFLDRHQVLNR